jgi:hypothetical protein
MNTNDYEEWGETECDESGIKNREVVEKFIEKYFKWIGSKKRIIGNETRELAFINYTGYARNNIKQLIYEMST